MRRGNRALTRQPRAKRGSRRALIELRASKQFSQHFAIHLSRPLRAHGARIVDVPLVIVIGCTDQSIHANGRAQIASRDRCINE